jgi:Trk-type K+ transport system membrane component
MFALISLLVVVSLSMLVIRIGTRALGMTGMSKEAAAFQSLSAFSGTGFTTGEAEMVVTSPERRHQMFE